MQIKAQVHCEHAVNIRCGISPEELVWRLHFWRWASHIVDQDGKMKVFQLLDNGLDIFGEFWLERTGFCYGAAKL
jgi:hypothetical protein